ncbi:Glucose-methanol-choline oxidoreductase [Rhodococcus sp. AW25M09]|nr:Glucose-methanol-choline oxidoreductase [Rhodococcus sp. AW25M09]
MLSGIGPADHLRETGVEVVVDAPGVGSYMQDHPERVIWWDAKKPMVTESSQWWEIGIFTRIDKERDRPDLSSTSATPPFDMHPLR